MWSFVTIFLFVKIRRKYFPVIFTKEKATKHIKNKSPLGMFTLGIFQVLKDINTDTKKLTMSMAGKHQYERPLL